VLSLDYWNKRSGEDYRLQQQGRRVGTSPPYELQELWLKKFLDDFSANRKCQKVRVLDYGCGYGRIAGIVCELETVDYFGFDISRSMTAPFRGNPPPRLQSNIDDRLRVADKLADAFSATEKFDVIFTLSVLIHNEPEGVKGILAAMLDRLAPGGALVLIENPHTAVSALENLWHGGCWCHSFARYFDGRADIEIIDNFADRHAIYISRAPANPRQSRFVYRPAPEAAAEALDLQSVLLRGLDRATVDADHLITEWSATGQDHGALVGYVHDLEEQLVTETSKSRNELSLARARFAEAQQTIEDLASETSKLRDELSLARARFAEDQQTIEDLASETTKLRKELSSVRARPAEGQQTIEHLASETSKLRDELSLARARFGERQQMLEDLAFAVDRTAKRHDAALDHDSAPAKEESRPSNTVEWNALQDTRYSHSLPSFDRVLQVFHKEWFGIRAAAGSLPGAKLAIPANVDLSHDHVVEIYDTISRTGYDRIVFHGVSNNTTKLIEFSAKRGLAEIVYVVKHGAPAQWDYLPERQAAFRVIELLQASKIKRLHFMKEGFRYPIRGLFQPMLFNLSPKFNSDDTGRRNHNLFDRVAFAPGWSIWRKNLYTNILAAAISERVRSIWVYAKNIDLPSPFSEKLRAWNYSTREFTFELIAQSSLCLNVSLVDCHPMINVEAQTIGRPCLRGNLYLDALEEHPYVSLTNVNDITSVAEICDGIERVLSVPSAEMHEIVLDYQTRSDDVARSRYLEFLEL
jgi:SAM-dependent methyltransferase/predicted metal-dependent hydrolase